MQDNGTPVGVERGSFGEEVSHGWSGSCEAAKLSILARKRVINFRCWRRRAALDCNSAVQADIRQLGDVEGSYRFAASKRGTTICAQIAIVPVSHLLDCRSGGSQHCR